MDVSHEEFTLNNIWLTIFLNSCYMKTTDTKLVRDQIEYLFQLSCLQ